MTQSPYTPPSGPQSQHFGYYAGSQEPDPLAPARRASVLMWVLGGLMMLLGVCNVVTAFASPMEEVLHRQEAMMPSGQTPPLTAEQFRIATIAMAGVIFVIGAIVLTLGSGVRAGRSGAIVGSMVIAGVIELVLALSLLIMMIAALKAPALGGFACVFAIPFGLFALLLVWLARSVHAAGRIRAMQQQYAMQYWQYQQQQQAYGQGYGTPGVPPPPQGYVPQPPGYASPGQPSYSPQPQSPQSPSEYSGFTPPPPQEPFPAASPPPTPPGDRDEPPSRG
jgi:hypothetical protein